MPTENLFIEFIDKIKSCKNIERATVVFLYGDLGAGKTTFTKGFCDHLGLNLNITSPTFVILKTYDFNMFNFKKLIHIDAYRLNSYDDLKKIKFEDYLEDINNLIFIEWPEILGDNVLNSDIKIKFEHLDNNQRFIEIL